MPKGSAEGGWPGGGGVGRSRYKLLGPGGPKGDQGSDDVAYYVLTQ